VFLIDTNIWIQLVRQRDLADDVNRFLAGVPVHRLFTTIFSVHGIGIVMDRHAMIDRYAAFLTKLAIGSDLAVISISIEDSRRIADAAISHGLDFDDAYQYAAAEMNNLHLVSLDADFDRTPRGRLTPAAALQLFRDEQRKTQQDA
jgi:predicted nucleic acid-binding protein